MANNDLIKNRSYVFDIFYILARCKGVLIDDVFIFNHNIHYSDVTRIMSLKWDQDVDGTIIENELAFSSTDNTIDTIDFSNWGEGRISLIPCLNRKKTAGQGWEVAMTVRPNGKIWLIAVDGFNVRESLDANPLMGKMNWNQFMDKVESDKKKVKK